MINTMHKKVSDVSLVVGELGTAPNSLSEGQKRKAGNQSNNQEHLNERILKNTLNLKHI